MLRVIESAVLGAATYAGVVTLSNETIGLVAAIVVLVLHWYWQQQRAQRWAALHDEIDRLKSENGTLAESYQLMLRLLSDVLSETYPHLSERSRDLADRSMAAFKAAQTGNITINTQGGDVNASDLIGRDKTTNG